MFLDFGDHRPETPSVPPVISRREGVLLSLVIHLSLTIAYLVTPASWFAREVVPYAPPEPRERVQFVMMEPLIERPAAPRPEAEASDLDRRATTIERPPAPADRAPRSRGNTPEKVEGAPPVEPPGGADGTADTGKPDPATLRPDAPALIPQSTVTPRRSAGEGLANSLRNLQRYLQNDNFSNESGGDEEQDALISFDSKGVDFGWWLRRFVTHVKSNWFIPQAGMIMQGRVVITFNVHRNGIITDLQLVRGSGNTSLDTAAMNALRTSNPTVALPAEYPADRAFFTVTFLYNIR